MPNERRVLHGAVGCNRAECRRDDRARSTTRAPRYAEAMISPDDVSAIFARHGVRGAWQALPAHGIANQIFATDDVVLRITTDHPEARPDARTEVVAAPVARAHGIAVP